MLKKQSKRHYCQALQNFGLLVAISMFGSGLGSLTLLPVILILANRKRKIIAN